MSGEHLVEVSTAVASDVCFAKTAGGRDSEPDSGAGSGAG